MVMQYDSHYVPAWTYNAGDPVNKKTMQEAIDDVVGVISEFPGATIIEQRDTSSEVGKGYYSKCACGINAGSILCSHQQREERRCVAKLTFYASPAREHMR